MKISKKKLILLIENFLNEEDFDIGKEDNEDNLDLSPDPELEKKTAETNRIANLYKNGVKDFLKLYQEKINEKVKPTGTVVKNYFQSDKFLKILEKPLYATELTKNNIGPEKFVNDIVNQIEKSQVQLVDEYYKKDVLGFLNYGKKDDRLHQKGKKQLMFY